MKANEYAGASGQAISLRSRLTSGFVWVLVANLVSQASGFARAVMPARVLGIESYGQFVTIQTTLSMIASFAGLGLGTTATRYVSRLRDTDPARAGRVLGFCNLLTLLTAGAFALFLLFFAEILSLQVFGAATLAFELRIGALFVFFFTINGYQMGALAGLEAFSALAWVTLAQSLFSVAVMFVAVRLWGLPGAVAALGIAAVVSWALYNHVLRNQCRKRSIRISYASVWDQHEVFGAFALPAALSGVIGGIVTAGGNALLVRQPDGLTQAAIFGAAATIRTVALFAPGVLSRVTLPVLSNLHGGRAMNSFRKTFWLGLGLSAGFAAITGLVLFLGAPLLLRLFGSDFIVGRSVVLIALVSAIFEVVAVNLFQVLYSYGRIWTHLSITAIWAGIVLGVTFLLAPNLGAAALAFAYLLAWILAAALYALVARSLFGQIGEHHV